MPTYTVSGTLYAPVVTKVEAASAEEAIRIAEERDQPRLCHQCSGGGNASARWVMSDGLSDVVENIEAEEVPCRTP